MIRQFIQRLVYCFYPHKIHIHTPERRPSDIYSPRTSSRRIYQYSFFQKSLERKLNDKI